MDVNLKGFKSNCGHTQMGNGGMFTREQAKELLVKFAQLFPGKQEKDADAVIQGWVFVDETTFDRILCVRKVTQGEYEAVWDSGHPEFCLGEELFPDMVPNKLPEPVEIIIKREKNG